MVQKKGLGAAGAQLLSRKRSSTESDSGRNHPLDAPAPATSPAAPGGSPDGIVAALQRGETAGSGGAVVMRLRLDQVAPHPDNPRDSLGDLEGLAGSIQALGQLQPILVVPVEAFVAEHPEHAEAVAGTDYVAGAGHRRRAAVEVAGLPTIDALLMPTVDRIDGYVTFIDENVHRAGLSALEEGRGYALMVDAGLSQRDIAARLRVSQGQVSKRLALLKLPQPVQDAISTGEVSVSDALALTGVPQADQLDAWDISRIRRIPLTSAIAQVERGRADDVTRAKARKKAELEKVPVIENPNDELRSPYEQLLHGEADVEKARAAGTLAAHPTGHGLDYYTTGEPVRTSHATATAATERERKAAMKKREVAAAALAQLQPTAGELRDELIAHTLDNHWEFANALRLAHRWQRETIGDPDVTDMYRWRDSLRDGPYATNASTSLLAWGMCVATRELQARYAHRHWAASDAAYLARLVDRVDYEPTTWEAARLAGIKANPPSVRRLDQTDEPDDETSTGSVTR